MGTLRTIGWAALVAVAITSCGRARKPASQAPIDNEGGDSGFPTPTAGSGGASTDAGRGGASGKGTGGSAGAAGRAVEPGTGGAAGNPGATILDQTGNFVYGELDNYKSWLSTASGDAAKLTADRTRADNMLTWQMPHGGFDKNGSTRYGAPWNGSDPRSGWTGNGGTELGIEGKNFAEGAVVLVGGVPAKTKRISGSLLEAKTPEGDDGKLVDVAVKNPDGQQAIQKRAFQYDARYRS